MTTLLDLAGIDAFYGQAHILHDLSLNVQQGERVAILGRNGVGKTTIVNACLGIASVRSGKVTLGGKSYKHIRHYHAARNGVAVVPQGRRIVPTLTVRENLYLGAAVDRPGRWNLEAVFDLFPILRERADTPGTAMSGGQQQMLAIGRALMSNPDLLILDEPSEGLAPVVVDELGQTLIKLAGQTSILLIEQNIRLVHAVAERYCVLSKGRKVEEGSMQGMSLDDLKKHIAV